MNLIGKILRWLLAPVAAAAFVAAVIAAARWAVSIADRRCPAESMIGGACVEPWHTSVVEVSIYAAVVLGTLGFVLLAALIAPHLKRTTAVVAFLIVLGVAGAGYFVMGWADLLTPLAAAALAGAAALWWVWSWRFSNDV